MQQRFYHSLWALYGAFFIMILIGGLTRLTGSGLSIVEWQPLIGILPPLTLEDWQTLFAKYQTSPEFQKVNYGLSLEEFKSIFWLEYIHRVWGRLLGIFFLIPTYFAFRSPAGKTYRPVILFIWILGLMQGAMGWLMVKSGLIDDPHVSPYRLTMHLMLGVGLMLIVLATAVKRTPSSPVFKMWCQGGIALVLLTIAYGGLVAGHKAGLIYNTFPLMGDSFLPEDILFLNPWWRNIYENPATVQFIHRLLAYGNLIYGVTFFVSYRSMGHGLLAALFFQVGLGILTLLFQVPVALGVLHQAGALLVASVYVFLYRQGGRQNA